MLKAYNETSDLHLKSAMQKVFDNILIHKFDAANLSHILYLKEHFNWSKEEEKAYINYLI